MTQTYFGDVLQSFSNGVQMDLRVKLAIEFLKAPGFIAPDDNRPPMSAYASDALDLADALLTESIARGLIKDLPDDGELNAPTRRHLERNVRAQLYQQQAAQRIQAEPANHLQVVPDLPRRQ